MLQRNDYSNKDLGRTAQMAKDAHDPILFHFHEHVLQTKKEIDAIYSQDERSDATEASYMFYC